MEFALRLKDLGLIGKNVADLLSVDNSLYHRIYNYAKRSNIWLAILLIDLGLIVCRIDGLNSKERLDQFMEVFKYKGKDWYSIPITHRGIIEKVLDNLNLSKEAFFLKYGITCVKYSEKMMIYKSIEEIREDLKKKNLIDTSIKDIQQFDLSNTYANIDSFAKNHGYSMPDIWFALGISYNSRLIAAGNVVKMDYVYHNDKDMIDDFISKGLIGKTKREVLNYDQGKTIGRISKYAKREDFSVQDLWDILEIKSSERKPKKTKIPFSNIDELSSIIKERGFCGKTIKDFKASDPDLYQQINHWASKNHMITELWSKIGIVRTIGFNSVDDILLKIKKAGYKSATELREKDRLFYKQISRFVGVHSDLTIKDIWVRAGLSFSIEGRPSK